MTERKENYDGNDDLSLIRRSDIPTFGTTYPHYIWINGTQSVVSLDAESIQPPGKPKGPFPFARLASVTSQSVTYLYHHINGTTFAEEPWDESVGTWGATEYIHM